MSKKTKEEEYSGSHWLCKKCKEPKVWFTKDETWDGAYDTYDYHCRSCGYRWHVVDECD